MKHGFVLVLEYGLPCHRDFALAGCNMVHFSL